MSTVLMVNRNMGVFTFVLHCWRTYTSPPVNYFSAAGMVSPTKVRPYLEHCGRFGWIPFQVSVPGTTSVDVSKSSAFAEIYL